MGYRFECPECNEKIWGGPTTYQLIANIFRCHNCSIDLSGFIDEDDKEEAVKDLLKRIDAIEFSIRSTHMIYK